MAPRTRISPAEPDDGPFHLFGLDDYDNSGGMGDYVDSFPTLEAAVARGKLGARPGEEFPMRWDWVQVAASRAGKLVVVHEETGRLPYVYDEIEEE